MDPKAYDCPGGGATGVMKYNNDKVETENACAEVRPLEPLPISSCTWKASQGDSQSDALQGNRCVLDPSNPVLDPSTVKVRNGGGVGTFVVIFNAGSVVEFILNVAKSANEPGGVSGGLSVEAVSGNVSTPAKSVDEEPPATVIPFSKDAEQNLTLPVEVLGPRSVHQMVFKCSDVVQGIID